MPACDLRLCSAAHATADVIPSPCRMHNHLHAASAAHIHDMTKQAPQNATILQEFGFNLWFVLAIRCVAVQPAHFELAPPSHD